MIKQKAIYIIAPINFNTDQKKTKMIIHLNSNSINKK